MHELSPLGKKALKVIDFDRRQDLDAEVEIGNERARNGLQPSQTRFEVASRRVMRSNELVKANKVKPIVARHK